MGGTWEQMPEASCHVVPAFPLRELPSQDRPLDKDSQRAFPSQNPLGKWLTQWVTIRLHMRTAHTKSKEYFNKATCHWEV